MLLFSMQTCSEESGKWVLIASFLSDRHGTDYIISKLTKKSNILNKPGTTPQVKGDSGGA